MILGIYFFICKGKLSNEPNNVKRSAQCPPVSPAQDSPAIFVWNAGQSTPNGSMWCDSSDFLR